MKKAGKILAGVLAGTMALSLVLTGCGTSGSSTKATSKVKAGIVLSTGGRGDKSFNDAAIAGLEKAKKDLGVDFKDVQPKDVADDEKSLEFLAKEGYDIVFAVGFMMADALAKVAPKYPKTKFAIIDHDYADKTPENVKGMVFNANEGSFLAGVLAAKESKSNVVGFIGGMDMPLIHAFEGGFVAGVKYAKPDATVLSAYAGTDGAAFNNPDKGKEMALDMISKKADVIYHAAGGTGQGLFEAASAKSIKAIGVDSNQNFVKPGVIIASMLKRVDVAVFDTVKEVTDNTFKGKMTKTFTLKDNGVGLTDLNKLSAEETTGVKDADQKLIQKMKDDISADTKKAVDDAKAKIISGDIKVPNWMLEGKPKK